MGGFPALQRVTEKGLAGSSFVRTTPSLKPGSRWKGGCAPGGFSLRTLSPALASLLFLQLHQSKDSLPCAMFHSSHHLCGIEMSTTIKITVHYSV